MLIVQCGSDELITSCHSVEATVLVLYESDAWKSPEENHAKASIARRLKADWGMSECHINV